MINIENEIWKEIPGYEGLYQVSNLGRVRTIERYVTEKNGKTRIKKSIIRKFVVSNSGYAQVTLTCKYKMKLCTVHRLVAITFLEKVSGKNIVNHINGIKTDNSLSNLEWCNKSENELHSYRVLNKINIPKGKPNYLSMKKVCQYDLKGNHIKTYDSITMASKETNTNRQKISDVCIGKRKKTNNFIWKHL